MATIAFGAALSHSPLMNFPISKDHEQLERFKLAVQGLAAQLSETKPDVLVVFGPDHFRTLFFDLMPAFVIGSGKVAGWGDWDTPSGPFATKPDLAQHILEHVLQDGFEPAFSRDLKVDHGITQPIQLMNFEETAILPIVINAAGKPLPMPSRCHAFGASVGRAIASFPEDLRVAVLASGGLSHDPPAPSDENALHGRTNGFAGNRGRESALMNRVAALQARINPDWDRMVLSHFAAGSAKALASNLTTESIFEAAGSGGQEIRTWIALAATLGDPRMNVVCYEPIEALITGMGVIST